MLEVQELVNFIHEDLPHRALPVCVYWFECTGQRGDLGAALRGLAEQCCIVPLAVRKGFDNANALGSDLRDALEEKRGEYEEQVVAAERGGQRVAIVVLSRTPLSEPAIQSPVEMPRWMPYVGGRVVNIDIVDAAASAVATLQAQSENIRRLQVLSYEVQGLMLARLKREHAIDGRRTAKFLGALLGDGVNASAFLHAADEDHLKKTPDGFRAVASPNTTSLLGRVVGLVDRTSPGKLPSLCQSMWEALALSDEHAASLHEPLFCVAFRSTNLEFETDRRKRGCRNAMLALYATSQVITASMHAAEYGMFSIVVMRSMVLDCLPVLSGLKGVLLE